MACSLASSLASHGLQSAMWSIGGSCNPAGQKIFDAFFKEILEDKEMECIQNHVGVTNLLGIREWKPPNFAAEEEEGTGTGRFRPPAAVPRDA